MTRNTWSLRPGHADLRRKSLPVKPVCVSAEPAELTIDLARTAVLVIDMQNDFVSAGGWLDQIGVDVRAAGTATALLSVALPSLRAQDVPIIWVNWGNRPDRANLPPNVLHVYDPDGSGGGIGDAVGDSDAVLTKGSWGAALTPALAPMPTDLFVDKYRMSGFVDTELDSTLRNLRVDTLLFAGVNADQCVYATLVDAACLGYDVVLLTDAVATTSPAFCMDATLYNVRQCYGFTTTLSRISEESENL